MPLHISAAAFHGIPVYFQVIAPWDRPWRNTAADSWSISAEIAAALAASLFIGMMLIGGFFARWNLRGGRGDLKGALRLAGFMFLVSATIDLLNLHLVPRSGYFIVQFLTLGVPGLLGLLVWIGYMAAEPYARRTWPRLMVSWQRLLSGRFRDPLVDATYFWEASPRLQSLSFLWAPAR